MDFYSTKKQNTISSHHTANSQFLNQLIVQRNLSLPKRQREETKQTAADTKDESMDFLVPRKTPVTRSHFSLHKTPMNIDQCSFSNQSSLKHTRKWGSVASTPDRKSEAGSSRHKNFSLHLLPTAHDLKLGHK